VPPFLNDQLGFLPADEPFSVQAFIAQPLHDGCGREFSIIVRADEAGLP
jgi:hypothetical protein